MPEEEKSLVIELLQDCKAKDKRNFVIIIVLIVALAVTNLGWLLWLSQYNIEYSTVTVDGKDSHAIYQEHNGKVDINDGKSNSN